MTKIGISMMARSLALELGPYGITVNALSPGPALTERTAQELPDYETSWARIMPTRTIVTVDDIATLRSPAPGDYT